VILTISFKDILPGDYLPMTGAIVVSVKRTDEAVIARYFYPSTLRMLDMIKPSNAKNWMDLVVFRAHQ
jgi:hypothetical protein